jgi:hypothetical protein
MKIYILSCAVAVAVLAASCSKSKTDPGTNNLPPGNNSFTTSIDGSTYTASIIKVASYAGDPSTGVQPSISIRGVSDKSDFDLMVLLTNGKLAAGTYPLSFGSDGHYHAELTYFIDLNAGSASNNAFDSANMPDDQQPGTITVTKADDHHAEGTFSGKICNYNRTTTKTVANGKFSINF